MRSALQSRAVEDAGRLIEKFATSSGRWLGWVGVAVGVAMIVAEPLTADRINPTVILLGVALICLSWIVLVRPRAAAYANGLVMQNMVRDILVPWRLIERCKVGQTLVISTTQGERFHGLGVTRSARTQMREKYGTTSVLLSFGGRGNLSGRAAKQERGPSMSQGEWQGDNYMSYVESRIAGLASTGERGATGDVSAKPFLAWAPIPAALLAVAVLCVLVALLRSIVG